MDVLLQKALFGGKELSHADAATLYMRTDDDQLRFAIRSKSDDLPSFTVPLKNPQTGQPNYHHVSAYVALTGKSVIIDDIYAEKRFDLTGTHAFDKESGYRSISMLTVPLLPRGGRPIGVLQLINAIDPETGEVIPFDATILGFVEAMAAQAAVALDNLRLAKAQETLLTSVTEMVASAIDTKSPYTGGHCERVPEVGRMLAEAACNATQGPFADFKMNKWEWREFHLAGWLHDCGKVSTPEYVVDKATKLETIYNRIHEVRTRFEVLLRDRIIDYQKGLLAGGDPQQLKEKLEHESAALKDDFDFLAECNVGGEYMAPAKIERLKQIATTPWQRHFSDRIGLSDIESRRLRNTPVPELPVTENLLADHPHHIVSREEIPLSFDTEKLGLKLTIPKHLYNYGELYNMAIPKGTLTPEERFKINEHVILSLKMLNQLPFPEEMSRVADIAASHHETMNGTGYPRKLSKAEMPLQSRIMAIADIFEALTARDRPYKKPKKMSEALKILNIMCREQHIDEELFDLFIESGVWQEYGETFLHSEQLDVADASAFLSR
ncbi:MAG: GAF domain-containing protein [Magnetococcales bacterium]|nr:GAF domain-containing protein [Magnetococcales bacterium]